jgi:hypothetical protein
VVTPLPATLNKYNYELNKCACYNLKISFNYLQVVPVASIFEFAPFKQWDKFFKSCLNFGSNNLVELVVRYSSIVWISADIDN